MIKHPFQKVSVIGLGYVGLPTAATLASRGLKVVGVDRNPTIVARINEGRVHIVEPDLDALVRTVVQQDNLRAVTEPEAAEVFLIAVPTPFRENREPDLTYVEAATRSIAPHLVKGSLVILESTSPVGTTRRVSEWLAQARPDLMFPHTHSNDADVSVAYCPERVLPGRVLRELIQNDRVIGGLTPRCTYRAKQLYKIFVEGECIGTNAATAEMAKLTENAYRDVNIAFANELSILCDRLDIDVWELIQLANRHPRVKILQPGPGVGGHCIAVDPWFLVHSAPEQARLIRTAREVNDSKPEFVARQVMEKAKGLDRPNIACLGLAFKADIDDLRESPAVEITARLAADPKNQLWIVEPYVSRLPEALSSFANVHLVDLDDALQKANVVVVLVNHRPFYDLPPELWAGKTIVDTKGLLSRPV